MEALHHCLFPWITRLVWKHYHPPLDFQDAEDVASEVVTQVWRYASRYRGSYAEASARRWILQMAHHRASRRLKALRQPLLLSLEDCAMSPTLVRAPKRGLEDALDLQQTWARFLASCTPRERQILRWRYEGLTLAEIGQRLGISGPRVHQVLRHLARRFREAQEQTSSGSGA